MNDIECLGEALRKQAAGLRQQAAEGRETAKRYGSAANPQAARLRGLADAYDEQADNLEQLAPALDNAFAEATQRVNEVVDLTKLAERGVVALEKIADAVSADPNTVQTELAEYRETIERLVREREHMGRQALNLLRELRDIDPEKYGAKNAPGEP